MKSEDFSKSSRQLQRATQIIMIFAEESSGYFPSFTLKKETTVAAKLIHPLTWAKIFHTEDKTNMLSKIKDPYAEKSLIDVMTIAESVIEIEKSLNENP